MCPRRSICFSVLRTMGQQLVRSLRFPQRTGDCSLGCGLGGGESLEHDLFCNALLGGAE